MNEYPKYIDLTPTTNISGNVTLPGSKSISNRSLLLAALAKGKTLVYGLLASDDTNVMLDALQTLGVKIIRQNDSDNYLVEGVNGVFPNKQADLFMGNAGTAIRPLTAALAAMNGKYKLHGVARMHERPIGDLIDALNGAGANIEYLENKGYPPILIKNGNINAEKMQVRGDVSSQFLTALLMASPLLSKNYAVRIEVTGELISKPYIEITLNMMEQFGVKVIRNEWKAFTIPQNSEYRSPDTLHVEGDASSASYFLAMGAITGTPICVHGIGKKSIQGDVRFIDALQAMGAEITVSENWIQSSSDKPLKAIDADFNHIPDAAMTLAVAALYAQGDTVLRNIGSWRVKETDRISAMATELRKLGAVIEEGEDWLRITPPQEIKDAVIDTYDDHRMAMCFSLASLNGKLRKGAKIRINNPECVAKTFPQYFQVFDELTKK